MSRDKAEALEKVRNIASKQQLHRGDHAEIADLLLRELRLTHPTVYAENKFWRYVGPVWSPILETELSTRVQSFAGRPVAPKNEELKLRAPDVSGSIKLASHRIADAAFFDGAQPGIAFADRFVAVDRSGLTHAPHSSEQRARAAYPFPFVDGAKPARFLAFMADVFRGNPDTDEKIRFIQEFGGSCIVGVAARFALALVLFGESAANGKSTLIRMMQAAMPDGSSTAIAPQLWGSEYRRARLAGVRLNAVSELPDADLADSEIFKAVVSGDEIDARPIREAPFSFRPIAGHVFAANRLPAVGDLTWGFWRRIAVLSFDRRFELAEQNATLSDEVIETERAAIVAWFLTGAARLLARGRPLVPPSSAALVESWRASADSVSCFVTEICEPDEHGTQSSALFACYREWANESGFRAVNTKNFAQRLGALGHPRTRHASGVRYPLSVRMGARS